VGAERELEPRRRGGAPFPWIFAQVRPCGGGGGGGGDLGLGLWRCVSNRDNIHMHIHIHIHIDRTVQYIIYIYSMYVCMYVCGYRIYGMSVLYV